MLVIFKGKRNKYTAFLSVKNVKELQAFFYVSDCAM